MMALYLEVVLELYLRFQLLPNPRAKKKKKGFSVNNRSKYLQKYFSAMQQYVQLPTYCQTTVDAKQENFWEKNIICQACLWSTLCPKKIFSAVLCLLFWHATMNLTTSSLIFLHSAISPPPASEDHKYICETFIIAWSPVIFNCCTLASNCLAFISNILSYSE